jgi:molecular chaperone GrpE
MRACRVSASLMTRQLSAASLPWACRRWNSDKATEGAAKEGEATTSADTKALEEKVAKLEKLVEDKNKEAEENKSKALYAAAEAENARRIAKIDIDKAKDFSVTAIAKDMLEVCDTLGKAIEAFNKLDSDTEAKAAKVLTGVKMSHNVLLHNLGRHGIEKMKVEKGQKFNPNEHDALFKSPVTVDVPADHIAAVVKDGYTIKSRVLRAAQVGVAENN